MLWGGHSVSGEEAFPGSLLSSGLSEDFTVSRKWFVLFGCEIGTLGVEGVAKLSVSSCRQRIAFVFVEEKKDRPRFSFCGNEG